MDALEWLLDSDPAIRWQAMRDLTDASPAGIAAERVRVSPEGLGSAILAAQQPDGSWRCENKPLWASTLFTLQLLRATGVDPTDPAVRSAAARLESGLRWNNIDGRWELRPAHTGGNTFFQGEVEPCINGGALAVGSCFGRPSDGLARRLFGEQLEDGGWNCEAPKSCRSSYHTTICVLEGLLEYEHAVGSSPELAAARYRGGNYLLDRHLYRRLSTGEVADPAFLELSFPPRYRYDILRALDYFRSAGAPPDERMADAVSVIENKRQADGRWILERSYDETHAIPFGEVVGQPSRWITLRALRVLRWYGSSAVA